MTIDARGIFTQEVMINFPIQTRQVAAFSFNYKTSDDMLFSSLKTEIGGKVGGRH